MCPTGRRGRSGPESLAPGLSGLPIHLHETMEMKPNRYHPLLVALHWLTVPMIMFALIMGGNVLVDIPNSDPAKIDALRGHMLFGLGILALTLVRLLTRLVTRRPAPAHTGNAIADRLSQPAHRLLYAFVLIMAFSGVATSLITGLGEIVFFGSSASLPASFEGIAPRAVHGLIAKVLMVLIVLHVLAALYHQLFVKDRLLARMWFGKR